MFAYQYYGKVAERVKDTGVSVRKRAIKIIKDMCGSNANFSEFNSACIEIISRISDEESSIQVLLARIYVYHFWFMFYLTSFSINSLKFSLVKFVNLFCCLVTFFF